MGRGQTGMLKTGGDSSSTCIHELGLVSIRSSMGLEPDSTDRIPSELPVISTIRDVSEKVKAFVGVHGSVPSPSLGIALGKVDVTYFARATGQQYTFDLRSEVHKHEGVQAIYPLLCVHVLTQDGGNASQVKPEQAPVKNDSLLAYTSIRLARVGTAGRKLAVDETVSRIGALCSPSLSLKVFLTLSDYPILVQFNATDVLHGQKILSSIQKTLGPYAHSTSTLAVLPFSDASEICSWKESKFRVEPSVRVGLLLWVQPDHVDTIRAEIASFLEKVCGSVSACRTVSLRQYGFWTLHYVFSGVSLHNLAYFVITSLAGRRGIFGTRIIPYMSLGGSGDPASQRPDHQPTGRGLFHSPLEKTLSVAAPGSASIQQSPIKGRPEQSSLAPKDSNFLVQAAGNLLLDWKWLKSRLATLGQEWERSDHLPDNDSIALLQAWADELTEIVEYWRNEYIDNPSDGKALFGLARALKEFRTRSEPFLSLFESLVSLYNELLEGVHIGATTEPYTRVGEHAGVFTLIMKANNNYMVDCCGVIKSCVPTYCSDVLDPHGKSPLKGRRWHGLVTSTTGRDFVVLAHEQVLFVPVQIKFSVSGMLFALPHEAAHFMISNLSQRSLASRDEQPDLVFRKLHRKLHRIVYYEILGPQLEKSLADQGYSCASFHIVSELFSDILGYLIGGPSFARALLSSYSGFCCETPSAQLAALPTNVRLLTGLWVCDEQKWGHRWRASLEEIYNQVGNMDNQISKYLYSRQPCSRAPNPLYSDYLYALRDPSRLMRLEKCVKKVVRRSVHFINEKFVVNPLFFHGVEPDDKYTRIQKLGERIGTGREIIFYEKPRDLMAALSMALSELERANAHWREHRALMLRLYLSLAHNRAVVKEPPTDSGEPHAPGTNS